MYLCRTGGVLIKYFMTQCIKLKQISEELFPLIAIMLSFQFWVRHLDVSTNQGNKNQNHEHFTFFIQKLKNRGCMDGRACHDILFVYSETEWVSSCLQNVDCEEIEIMTGGCLKNRTKSEDVACVCGVCPLAVMIPGGDVVFMLIPPQISVWMMINVVAILAYLIINHYPPHICCPARFILSYTARCLVAAGGCCRGSGSATLLTSSSELGNI